VLQENEENAHRRLSACVPFCLAAAADQVPAVSIEYGLRMSIIAQCFKVPSFLGEDKPFNYHLLLSKYIFCFYYSSLQMDQSIIKQRLLKALIAVSIATAVGTFGFYFISGGTTPIGDCLYMTITTLATVGYGEVIPMTPLSRAFACFLIVFGVGTLLYFASTVVALWVELDMSKVRRRRKMEKTISQLSNHIIVCGVGTTGGHVVRELIATKTPFVMIDTNEAKLEEMHTVAAQLGKRALGIVGDATEDKVLEDAGISRARGLVAALRNDKDNLYLILSARYTNPKLRIVSRATEEDAAPKIMRAGADRVISPNLIGGLRIASEMLRPEVVEFLDMMMRDMDKNTRIEQVTLPPGSPLSGMKLANTNIRKSTDVLVIAVRDKNRKYTYNPGPDTVLSEEATLIVLGAADSVIRLRESIVGRNNVV
jgi:voltage-gated potassium channel